MKSGESSGISLGVGLVVGKAQYDVVAQISRHHREWSYSQFVGAECGQRTAALAPGHR